MKPHVRAHVCILHFVIPLVRERVTYDPPFPRAPQRSLTEMLAVSGFSFAFPQFSVPDLRRDLEKTTGDRYRCPVCDARRGLSLEQDEGQTGVWHCFACQAGGTGAELYAEMHHVGIAKALDAFGVSGSDVAREVQAQEKARPRPSWDPSPERMQELYHAWSAMTRDELRRRDKYRQGRIEAAQRKDHEAFDYWHGKWKALHQHVLEREVEGHQKTEFIDANTDHLA